MPLKELYRKVDAFQNNLGPEAKSLSQCKKGCSRCCMVDLSVFEVEAASIRDWFRGLEESKRRDLRAQWDRDVPSGQCSFLVGDACTIYEARPLICRTQGLPLRFHEGGQTFLDVCPLNEDMLNVAGAGEIMNLDLLNLILAQIERGEGTNKPRTALRELLQELLKG